MSKKKVAKLGLTAAVAATTFVAANPADAASVSQAEQAVKKAEQNAKGLVKFYSSEDLKVSAEFTASYNNVRKLISDAKAQLANYKGKDKSQLEAILASAENHQAAAARYIDAVGILNGKLVESTKAVSAYIKSQELNADTVAAYDTLSAEIKKAEAVIGKVRGAQIRKAFKDSFLLDAKLTREALIYEVSQYQLLNQINEKLKAEKVDLKEVQADFAKLDRLKERAVDIKKAGKELYPDRDDVYPTHTAIEQQLRKSEADAKEAYVAKLAPAVESVSAINAKQLLVTFNKKVNVADAQTVSNYDFTGINGSAIGAVPASAVVQEDGKSVLLTLTTPITTETTFTSTVSGIKVKDSNVVIPQFASTVKYKDEVKADIAKVESYTNGSAATSLQVTFTEPVASATYKVNGVVKSGVLAGDGLSATISGLSLSASETHTLEVLNLTDYGTNVNSHVSKTFSVTKDVAIPNISVSALNDNELLLTFDKKMNATTVNTTNVKVKNESLDDLVLSGLIADPKDTTGTKFIASLPAGLYSDKSSRNLTVLLNDSVTDSLGNKLPNQFKNVTISKDTVAPTVTNVTFTKDTTTKNVDKVVLEFSEGLAASAGISTAGIKVIGPNGVDVSSGFFAATSSAVAKNDTKVEIPVSATVSSGKYTLYLPTGLAVDVAQTANNSVAVNKVVDFGAAQTNEFKIAQSAIAQTASNTTNVITVNYGTTVKGGAQAGSATDLNNYTLNGAPLPEGTLITLNGALDTATITIPDETVAQTDTAAVLRITNVQNTAGTVITPFVGTTSVTDSIAPVLSTVVLNSNGTFTVGFGETLDTAAVLGDFDVKVNGKAVAATEITFTPAVGGDAGKYVFAVNGLVSDNGTAGDASDDFLYINADGVAGYQAATDVKVTGAVATAGVVNLNSSAITSVTVATKAAGPLTGADTAGNTLKLNVSKSVK
ncbi:hypothetical protein [Metabacillus fastidiosus]|uniref:hypothetical protein n=1 Tax=Metabacillus fastidiosus TaxID=1458 RepID=UPI003D2B3067